MTQKQYDHYVKALLLKGRRIEAGFVAEMLSLAPDDVTQAEISNVRATYFFGAKRLFDLLTDPKNRQDGTIDQVMRSIREELREFAIEQLAEQLVDSGAMGGNNR